MEYNKYSNQQQIINHEKPCNIHVNPMFNDPFKSVIHINPKVQLNTAIHVNPRMMNSFSTCELQQVRNEALVQQPISTAPKVNVTNSVYVNPKFMQKLTTKVPDTAKNECIKSPTRPQVDKSTSILKTRNAIVNKNSNVKKYFTPNLVSLSKSKLVRVRPSIKSMSAVTSTASPKIQKSIKIIDSNRLRKFTTISPTKLVTNKSKTLSRTTLPNNRYKIDRTKIQKVKVNKIRTSQSKVTTNARVVLRRNAISGTNKNLIKIDGVMYKSSKSQLVKSTSSNETAEQRKKFNTVGTVSTVSKLSKHAKASGKISKIRSSITKTSIACNLTFNSSQRLYYKHLLRNRAKQKSIQILRHKMSKNNQPCLLFQRFGFCAKYTAGTCPKVHDKKQVALCKNFLQGKCLLDNCRLSHEVGPEKMPTCKYFLDGCCIRDACPYLHIKFSSNTPICISFLQGYCAKGNKCKERHTNVCPEFEKTGKCAKGKNCPYPHKSSLSPQRRASRNSKTSKSLNNQVICNKKTDSPAITVSREEIKKRYYDKDKSSQNENITTKKMKILDKINLMKIVHTHSATQNSSISLDSNVDNQNAQQQTEEHSQTLQSVQYKRPPIGPCPAYIPI